MVLSSGQTRPGGNHVGPQCLVRRRLVARVRAGRHPRAYHHRSAHRALPHRRRRAGGARGSLLPPFRAALHGPARGRRPALHVSRAEVRARRALHRDPRPEAHPAERLRAPLSRRRARRLGVGLDGRRGRGRPGGDPAVAGARRSRLPAESRPSRLRRALPADRRQSPRPFASVLRAREDAGPRHAAMGRRTAAHAAAGARPARAALARRPPAARLHEEEARRAGRRVEFLRFLLSGSLPAAHQLLSCRAPPGRAAGRSPIGRRCSCASTSRP